MYVCVCVCDVPPPTPTLLLTLPISFSSLMDAAQATSATGRPQSAVPPSPASAKPAAHTSLGRPQSVAPPAPARVKPAAGTTPIGAEHLPPPKYPNVRESAYVGVDEGEGEGGREAREAATAASDVRWLDMKSLRSMFVDSDNAAGVKGDGQNRGGTTWRERGGFGE